MKTVSGLMLTLLLVSMLFVAFDMPVVMATGTIYIRADGSIDGPANITTLDYVTYYFNESNYDEIVVEKDNIVVDGAGYTVQGTGDGIGITLEEVSNVTIKNANIQNFNTGICFDLSSHNTISGNNITNNSGVGIFLGEYDLINFIKENNITNNSMYGIFLHHASENVISGNDITNSGLDGIYLTDSSNNTISRNNITGNWNCGISLINSSNNSVYNNNFVDNSVHADSYESANMWDNGYPLSGNYWDSYDDEDLYCGPFQDETGSDNIWDHPYVMDENNQDNYPLTDPIVATCTLEVRTTISSLAVWGTTYPAPSLYVCPANIIVVVKVVPSYFLRYWTLDGCFLYETGATIAVTMNVDHRLCAHLGYQMGTRVTGRGITHLFKR